MLWGKTKYWKRESKKGRKAENLIRKLFLLLGNPCHGAVSVTDRRASQESQKEKGFCLVITALYHVQLFSPHTGRWSFFMFFLPLKRQSHKPLEIAISLNEQYFEADEQEKKKKTDDVIQYVT